MTIAQLDRLVTKTELNPVSKTALKGVRRAIQSGRCGDAVVGEAQWSISLDSVGGIPMRLNFSFRREN